MNLTATTAAPTIESIQAAMKMFNARPRMPDTFVMTTNTIARLRLAIAKIDGDATGSTPLANEFNLTHNLRQSDENSKNDHI